MGIIARLKKPPWRTFVLLIGVLGALGLIYLLWSPGKSVRDGRNDRGSNGMWLQHGWLGHDSWFDEHGRDRTLFRVDERVDGLSSLLRDLFDITTEISIEGLND